MRAQQILNISYVIFHNLINMAQSGIRLTSLVENEGGAVGVREVFDAFGGDHFDEFDMPELGSNVGQVLVDQVAELVAILVQVDDNMALRIHF